MELTGVTCLKLPSTEDGSFFFGRCLAARLQEQLARCRGEVLDCLASFEPALPIPGPGLKNLPQALVKSALCAAHLLRRPRFLDHCNSAFFSSYLLAVYRRGINP